MKIHGRFGLIAIFFLLFFQGVSLFAEAPAKKVETYDQLVAAIREVRVESRKRVEQAVAQEKVREAWETGKLIDEHILLHQERAEYGKQVLLKLAKDLGVSDTELGYMLRFARAYPIAPAPGQLNWAHYRELLSLNDPKEREQMTQQAESHHWSQKKLRREIKKLKIPAGAPLPAEVPLEARPGIPGTYRVLKATVGEFAGALVLDLGFSNFFKPENTTGLQEGDIVTFEKGKLQKSEAGEEVLYTYQVDVIEVIDGDTLKVAVPLGFGFTTVQKLRLRGLDAPEIVSADGQEAKDFLEERLLKANMPVIIKTVKSDKYDRYLADIWVTLAPNPTGTAGKRGEQERLRQGPDVPVRADSYIYVNQELLDEGLAVRFEE
jgi:endonuclease YncB( thermonuclease family)